MKWIQIFRYRELVVLLMLIVLVAVIGVINPAFLQVDSLQNMLNSSIILILVGLGEMFVILTRGIDVSVGAEVGLSAVILGLTLNAGVPLGLAILLSVLTGMLAGMVNGFGVTKLRIPPIIMTLGTMGAYRGVMPLLTGGSWIETIPQVIKDMAGWSFLNFGAFAWFTLLAAAGLAFVFRRLKQSRYFFAVGDNENGAYIMGVPVGTTRFLAYTIAGMFAGLAAVVFVAQIGFVPMATGDGLEMRAIAADVMGGVNLAGGVGSPFSAVIGAIFLTVMDSVMVYVKVPAEWNNAIAGTILLVVVLIDFRIRKEMENRQRRARAESRATHVAAPAANLNQPVVEESR